MLMSCAITRRCLTVATAIGLSIAAGPMFAYEPGTHRRIEERAVDVSTADRVLKDQFSLFAGKNQVLRANTGQALTLRDWIGEGAYMEDTPFFRPRNHFHTPLLAWPAAGLNSGGLSGDSSVYWQQAADQSFGGTWSWPFARRRFHDFLTSSNQADRDAALADVARAIGHMSHLIQDATSPPHTRNDAHIVYDGYEKTMERFRVEEPFRFSQLLGGAPIVANTAIFTATGDARAPATIARLIDSDTYAGAQPPGNGTLLGASEYTSGGYVSDDTIFLDFPFPSPASLGAPFFDPPAGTPGARRYFPKDFDGDRVSHFVAEGALWERLRFRGQTLEGYILDTRTYEAAGRFLVPRAVGYSASLIDKFFQREIEISAPARYVYGRAPFVDGNTGSFTKLTFKVRKTTPGATGAGMLTAVMRYRSGLDNLIENPFPVSNQLSYAVSAEKPATLGSAFTELTFDFAASPIPTNSADLYLTVVYRGPSGAEQTAVLYGDKDLFEPDPVDVGNITDYDCFGVKPYHVADFSSFPPFDLNNSDPVLNPQPRDLTDPKDGIPELFGPDDELNNVFMKVSSFSGPFASTSVFDYQVGQRVAQPDPQYVRFFVIQDQPSYVLSWRPGKILNRGFVPNGFSFNPLLATVPSANVNRVFVDASGIVRHQLVLPLVYRGLTSLNLNVLVTSIPRINTCFPNTVSLPPALSRIEGAPAQP
jgi:hypothetical protein